MYAVLLCALDTGLCPLIGCANMTPTLVHTSPCLISLCRDQLVGCAVGLEEHAISMRSLSNGKHDEARNCIP